MDYASHCGWHDDCPRCPSCGEHRHAGVCTERGDELGSPWIDGCPRNPEPHTIAECLAAEHERSQG